MVWLFISGGLVLGWSLGANDGVNVFGTAVASRMVRFKTAAAVASIFVILGAVVSGAGPARTLNDLGAVNALAGSFTVIVAAAAAIFWMTRIGLPISTSQAVVGGIIGWNLFTGSPTDINSFTKIVSTWVLCPVLAAAFAYVLFKAVNSILRRAKIHILQLDAYTRVGFVIAGAFASYSLGANNIANVMGLFVPSSPFRDIALTSYFKISGMQQLFLLGGAAIAVGIFSYSYRVMHTVGGQLYKITPLSGLLVVISQALVLFFFASERLEAWLASNGLPTFPLVPVSSTQAVIGAVIGVGLARGAKGINFKILGRIAAGWVLAPLAACMISFVALFFMQNVFEQKVVNQLPYELTLAAVEALEAREFPAARFESLKSKRIVGAANLRNALRSLYPWREEELFTIFSFAEIDSMRIDTVSILKADLGDQRLSPGQFRALAALHGREFAHRWQLDEALVSESEEWQPQQGKGHEARNKDLRLQYSLIHEICRRR